MFSPHITIREVMFTSAIPIMAGPNHTLMDTLMSLPPTTKLAATPTTATPMIIQYGTIHTPMDQQKFSPLTISSMMTPTTAILTLQLKMVILFHILINGQLVMFLSTHHTTLQVKIPTTATPMLNPLFWLNSLQLLLRSQKLKSQTTSSPLLSWHLPSLFLLML
jgi:hypothetical protein